MRFRSSIAFAVEPVAWLKPARHGFAAKVDPLQGQGLAHLCCSRVLPFLALINISSCQCKGKQGS